MNEKACTAAGIAAVIVAAVILTLHLVFPVPEPKKIDRKRQQQELNLLIDIKDLRDRVTETRTYNDSHLWQQNADKVGASAMALVTKLANNHELKVNAFRPQRVQDDSGLTRLPYLVAVEGRFPSVIAFVQQLETPTTKLAVNTLQIASADGASDQVSASVGIVAYKEGITSAK